MGQNVLDLTSLAFQPKLCDRFTHPKRHVTLLYRSKKLAYPAHTQELDEDEDDEPLVCSDRTADSEDEDDQPLVQPASRNEPVKEKRESAAERRNPDSYEEERGPPVWQDPSATLEQDVSGKFA